MNKHKEVKTLHPTHHKRRCATVHKIKNGNGAESVILSTIYVTQYAVSRTGSALEDRIAV